MARRQNCSVSSSPSLCSMSVVPLPIEFQSSLFVCSHKDTGTTSVRDNLMSIVNDVASIVFDTDKHTADNKLMKYSKVISEMMVYLSIQHPDAWKSVTLVKDDGEVTSS